MDKLFVDIVTKEFSNIEIDPIPAYLLESVKMDSQQEKWLRPIIDYSQMDEE